MQYTIYRILPLEYFLNSKYTIFFFSNKNHEPLVLLETENAVVLEM